MTDRDLILAAGGVVWRKKKKKIEILLVHRPKYDDWSIPKGKAEVNEPLHQCALREVREETGLEVYLGPTLCEVSYLVPEGLKRVKYWAAKAPKDDGLFKSNAEIDQIEWLEFNSAYEKCTKDSDREVLAAFIKSPYDSETLILLRHAKALPRFEWLNEDMDRPLNSYGSLQAKGLVDSLSGFDIDKIFTSDAIRCYDTIAPLASKLSAKIRVERSLSEDVWSKDKKKAIDLIFNVIKERKNILICSHNPVLPKILKKLTKKMETDYSDGNLEPADAWILFHDKKKVMQVDYLPAPNI